MHLVRYELDGSIRHGILDDGSIAEIEGDFSATASAPARWWRSTRSRSRPRPRRQRSSTPPGNYESHMAGAPKPPRPKPFLAPSTSVTDPGANVVMPRETPVSYEGEMAVVISKRGRHIAEDEVSDYILGVCCANDVSAYEWVGADSDWFRGKGSDTFSPFGPWITPGLDYRDLQLITRVNGEVVEDTRTTKMFYGVDELVSYVSRYMTVEPGDVFFTGTSGESTPLNDGDVVEVEVEGNGVLSNTFVLAP